MANTTAMASGTEQVMRHAGEEEHRHEHDADAQRRDEGGDGDLLAPSRIACSRPLPMLQLRLMFSMATVASSTRMPTASASPPRVMMLMVSPSAEQDVMR